MSANEPEPVNPPEDEPDTSEDPRKEKVGEGGYPETQPGGAGDDDAPGG